MKKCVCFLTIVAVFSLCASFSWATTLLMYDMDEQSGQTLLDSSGGGRNATMADGLTRISDPGYGGAVNNVMAVADRKIMWSDLGNPLALADLSSITVEARIKPTNFPQQGLLFSLGSGDGSALGVVWDHSAAWNPALGRLYVVTYNGGWQYQAIDFNLNNTFVTNQWQDFKLVYQETGQFTATYEIYKNGNLIGSITNAIPVVNNADTVKLIEAGVWYRQYEGAIDEFKVTDVPEPATMLLLGLGALISARRAKK